MSENGDSEQSFEIVKEFSSQLPIRYIKQPVPVSAYEHFLLLANEVQSRYVAMLADDDIWARYHLEEAFRCFELNPSIHAYFGQAVVVHNETCFAVGQFSGSFLQVPFDDNRGVHDFLVWSRTDVAINCLANTPVNLWSVVALADSHRAAILSSAGDPVFGVYPSSDRLYIWRLGIEGEIGVGRNVSLFYRNHPESEIQTWLRCDLSRTEEEDCLISREIARQAMELGIDVIAEWRKLFRRAHEFKLAGRIDMTEDLKEFLLDDQTRKTSFPSRVVQNRRSESKLIKNLITLRYMFIPPAVFMLLNKLKTLMP